MDVIQWTVMVQKNYMIIMAVDGYDSKFKVTIYRLDAPRYIPNKI